ncbi:MAG: 50S ribosomal protein L1 [Candidatus Bathyarchaeota archaeon]|jgi:large subunit ribosomal protein L1
MSLDTKALLESIKQAREKSSKRKFSQSIELIVNLRDIDMKKPEGKIQERIELPNGVGKQTKICVFASGELALKAKRAGADLVMERRELEALAGDKKKRKSLAQTYDYFIAEAPLMPVIGKILGSALGPKGRMPSPVPPTANIAEIMKKQRKTVIMRTRGQPVLQCRIGSEEMPDEQVVQNVRAVLGRLEGRLKRGLENVESIYIKTTMGSAVKIKV